jgi:pilus assembly protein Flp/PilA
MVSGKSQAIVKEVDDTKKNERGASLVEYALLVALIAAVAMGAITTIGTNATAKLESVSDTLAGSQPAQPGN